MKLTQKQFDIVGWWLDIANNDDNWYYTETKNGDTKIFMRKPVAGVDSADPEYWGEPKDITETVIAGFKTQLVYEFIGE